MADFGANAHDGVAIEGTEADPPANAHDGTRIQASLGCFAPPTASAMTITLIASTSHYLLYILTEATIGTGTVANSGGGSPDLLTDTIAGTPLRRLIDQAVANQSDARNKFLTGFGNGSGILHITPREGDAKWRADVNISSGRMTLDVTAYEATGQTTSTAYLEVEFRHRVVR